MSRNFREKVGLTTLIFLIYMVSCNYYVNHNFRKTYRETNALLHSDSSRILFLKAHMKNGDVVIFENNWKINPEHTLISGFAKHYDFNRFLLSSNNCVVPVDSVAIFETNDPIRNRDAGRIAALSILTAADVALGIYCITNPKACFGSCPTFYYGREDNVQYANAEGFSSSICPSLEQGDIDALNNPETHGGVFELTMKNEALENHAVNQVKLLAVPRKENTRVFNDAAGKFYVCSNIEKIASAMVNDSDITGKLLNIDDKEYYGHTDSNDLSQKEVVRLTFNNNADQDKGLVINFRQTLLTTFLLYTAYGYMGDEVGDLFAQIETDSVTRKKMQPFDVLGGIEVSVFDEKKQTFRIVETVFETGPIAKNLQIVRLPSDLALQKNLVVQLRVSRGYWRIDYTALATIDQEVTPIEIPVSEVMKNQVEDTAALHNLLADDTRYEASVPGDRYRLTFRLPENKDDYELFVYSKGYYLEWIRKSWLSQKNMPALLGLVNNDPTVWHSLAREYKAVECDMESTFWSSKVYRN